MALIVRSSKQQSFIKPFFNKALEKARQGDFRSAMEFQIYGSEYLIHFTNILTIVMPEMKIRAQFLRILSELNKAEDEPKKYDG